MTKSKEFRQRGWNALKGKYGTGLGVCVIEAAFISIGCAISSIASNQNIQIDSKAIAFIFSLIGFLVSVFVVNPIAVGVNNYFLNAKKDNGTVSDMFAPFKNNYMNTVKTMFVLDIKVFLWSLLFVIPGIIKSLEYSMIPYILAEEPNTTLKEAFAASKQMMTGNKWRYFKLGLSFIGWNILGALAFGIGCIFVAPYMGAAFTEFYLEVSGQNTTNNTTDTNPTVITAE